MLQEFCNKYIKSFVCWDLIIFFYDNKGGIEADDEMLSNSIGRSQEEISRNVKDLLDSALLIIKNERYQLNEDNKIRKEVEDFVRAVDDRSIRLTLLTTLLRKGIS